MRSDEIAISEQKSMNESFKKIAEDSAVRNNDANAFATSKDEELLEFEV